MSTILFVIFISLVIARWCVRPKRPLVMHELPDQPQDAPVVKLDEPYLWLAPTDAYYIRKDTRTGPMYWYESGGGFIGDVHRATRYFSEDWAKQVLEPLCRGFAIKAANEASSVLGKSFIDKALA